MAKKPNEPVAEPKPEVAVEAKPEAPAGPKRYRVNLTAGTPIAFNPAEVEAVSPTEAWGKFCELNGISDSTCPRDITEVK